MPNFFKKNTLILFVVSISLVYLFGILSTAHYTMGDRDFYIGLVTSVIASMGLIGWFLTNTVKKVGFSTLTWLALTIIIIIQPFVASIDYLDSLIFPVGTLIISVLISIATVNIPINKQNITIKYLATLFLLGGVLVVITQLSQLFFPNQFGSIISPIYDRLYSNLSQPNQAGFVITLGISAQIYLMYRYHNDKKLFCFLITLGLLLAMGIGFTASRTALVLLTVSLIGILFYPSIYAKQRLSIFFVSSSVSIIGYFVGTALMSAFLENNFAQSGVNRLVSGNLDSREILIERAIGAFSSNPIFGVGYGNYLSFSLDNIERWRWYENAQHAHNFVAQIGAELGLLGILAMMGALFVIVKHIWLFLTFKLTTEKVFVCLLLSGFLLYSLSEYPLWYTRFLFVFVLLVALLDKGFLFASLNFHKVLSGLSVLIALLGVFYLTAYNYYLYRYEVVMYAEVKDMQKIRAYQVLPTVFGFTKFKEEMLHMVMAEDNPDTEQHINLGYRVMRDTGSVDVMRVQSRLLMKSQKVEQADKLNRMLCIREHQAVKRCDYTLNEILLTYPSDESGYAKRLNDWYVSKYR